MNFSVYNVKINFKPVAPSKLYWADKQSMRIIQALYWLKDIISINTEETESIRKKLTTYIIHSEQRIAILHKLQNDLYILPNWMQTFLQETFVLISEKNRKFES